MPLSDEPEALTTNLWRVIFSGPAFIGIIIIFLFLFVFKYDTPLFYKRKGDLKNYDKIMSLIYVLHESQEEISSKVVIPIPIDEVEDQPSIGLILPNANDITPILVAGSDENEVPTSIEKNISPVDLPAVLENSVNIVQFKDKEVVIKSKVWPAHYKKALVICGLICLMHQTNGINAVIFFSNALFTEGKDISFLPHPQK